MEPEKKSGNSPPNLQHPSSNFFFGGGFNIFFFRGWEKTTKLDSTFPSKSCFSPGVEQFSRQCGGRWFRGGGGKSSDQFTTLVICNMHIYIYVYTIYIYIFIFTEREGVHEKLSLMFSYTTSYRNNIYIYTPGMYIYQLGWFLYIYIHIYVTYTTLSTFGSWKKKSAVKEPRFISRLYNSPRVHGSPLLNWERRQAEKIAGWLRVF